MLDQFNVPLERLSLAVSDYANISLFMARIDQIHPLASGNKLYKLLPNIEFAQKQGIQQLLSFGGAFSNHIHALALYAQSEKMRSIGMIRGEAAYANNPTLRIAKQAGMTLVFMDRVHYRQRHDQQFLARLQQRYPQTLIIPEGGSNALARQGCRILAQQINQTCWQQEGMTPDVITVACGTGTTFVGLVEGAASMQRVRAYLVVKDASVYQTVNLLLVGQQGVARYQMDAADFGGYAKLDATLISFILQFLEQTDILLDPIYTSKMCQRVIQQIDQGMFSRGSSVVMVHSGGLQAWYGMNKRVVQTAGEAAWGKIKDYL